MLTEDIETGAATSLVSIVAGGSWQPLDDDHWTELWVIAGSLREGASVIPGGSYYCLAPDRARPTLHALSDSTVLWFTDVDGPRIAKGQVRLLPDEIAGLGERRPSGAAEGVFETILSSGPGGSVTRLLRVLPFVSTGVFVHDHAEEVFLLAGAYKMADEFHTAGTYTCKGSGVSHGPFLTSTGYTGLEVRNFSGS